MHAHQVRRRGPFIPNVSDIHRCRTSRELLSPLMSRTCRHHLNPLTDEAQDVDMMRRILKKMRPDRLNRVNNVMKLRRRRSNHHRLPLHVAVGRDEDEYHIHYRVCDDFYFIFVFGYF